MDDASSTASFEVINASNRPTGQNAPVIGPPVFSDEDKNIQKLRALVAKATVSDDTASGLAEDEVPDVCYVLQYKGWGGKLIDGSYPIPNCLFDKLLM